MRGDSWIQSKLDRCFGNKEWFKLFPVSNQTFLEKRGSDHRPVLVKLTTAKESYRGNFRFDKRFFNKPNVKRAISQAWNSHRLCRDGFVSDKLRTCRKALSRWKRENNINSLTRITQDQMLLEQEQSSDFPCTRRLRFLKRNLCKAYREEEDFWKQKSQQKWLKVGDKNQPH